MTRPSEWDQIVDSLARFQLGILLKPIGHPRQTSGSSRLAVWHNYVNRGYIDSVAAYTRDSEFELLGVGTTRFAVKVETPAGEAVAKIAWNSLGLADSLNEAAVSIAAPERIRRHLAKGIGISAQLVLLVESCEPISPPILRSSDVGIPVRLSAEEWEQAEAAAAEATLAFRAEASKWLPEINRVRRSLGAADNTAEDARWDNWGLNSRGELVVLDFDVAPSDPNVQRRVFERLASTNWLWLDDSAAPGPEVEEIAGEDGGPANSDNAAARYFPKVHEVLPCGLTLIDLVGQAGWEVTDLGYCPCASGRKYAYCCKRGSQSNTSSVSEAP